MNMKMLNNNGQSLFSKQSVGLSYHYEDHPSHCKKMKTKNNC